MDILLENYEDALFDWTCPVFLKTVAPYYLSVVWLHLGYCACFLWSTIRLAKSLKPPACPLHLPYVGWGCCTSKLTGGSQTHKRN